MFSVFIRINIQLNFTHPADLVNLRYIQIPLVGGAILASPFILYQVWLFIAPGLYQKERRFVVPFMAATVGLFLTGAYFGYFWVLPAAVHIMLDVFGKKFTAVISIEEYTSFFFSLILGMGATFELPVVIFFLALFGIVDAKFLLKHFRYAILAIFLVAAVICPDPSPIGMCIFASPMLVLYFVGVLVAFLVHPDRRRQRMKEAS